MSPGSNPPATRPNKPYGLQFCGARGFRHIVREWCTVCRRHADGRGVCRMHCLDLFGYLAGVGTASMADLAVPPLLPATA